MDKARITYRFDGNGQRTESRESMNRTAKDERGQIVIPLRSDEWEAREEQLQAEEAEPRERSNRKAEPVRLYDTQPLNQFTTDFGAWQSPFEAEVDRLERMIRDTGGTDDYRDVPGRKPPGDAESRDGLGGDGWGDDGRLLPAPAYDPHIRDGRSDAETGYFRSEPYMAEGPIVLEEPAPRYGRVNRGGKSAFRAVSSISGAVITGLLFGLFIISLFNGGDEVPTGTTGSAGEEAPTSMPDGATAVDSGSGGKALPAQGTVSVEIPGQSYFVLQYGLFSSSDRAATAIADLQKLGLAGAAEANAENEHLVYAGFTLTRDDALVLDHLLEGEQLETFIKAFELPAVDRILYDGADTGAVERFFAQTDELARMVSGLAYVHLEERNPTPLEATSLESLSAAHQEWASMQQSVAGGLGPDGVALLQKMNNDMNTAVTTLGEYRQNPSAAYLWQAQAALMRALIAEKALLSAISG